MIKISTIILGISAYYHDSAASIIKDGEIIAAAQEERFTRKKGDNSFPHNAINFCLNSLNITLDDVDHIVFYENFLTKFERLLISYHSIAPRGIISYIKSMPKWITSNLFLENKITYELGVKKRIVFCDHHMSHAASAFYPSPFKKAAILTIDGVGEWSTTTFGIGDENKIDLLKELTFPNSLGLLYSAFTYYTGFKVNSGEYKLMGLAPYGEPTYVDLIKKEIVHINDDGSIILNQKYFNYASGLTMTNKHFNELFGGKPRKPESKITKREMDIARSIQEVCNEIIIKMCIHVKNITKCNNLVLAGGVALNVVSMGKIEKECGFDNVWIQPASGDAGGSLGAALWYYYDILKNTRKVDEDDSLKSSYLGPCIDNGNEKDNELLERLKAKYTILSEEELIKEVAKILNEGKIVAIARGRMEWGPRALGNRSILGSAKDVKMQSKMNLKIKKRESFRPFAPIVLLEDADKYFDIEKESPYMLKTFYVKESLRRTCETSKSDDIIKIVNQTRSTIPAVTHVDYSSRVQTISKKRNAFIYNILKEYKKLSNESVLINTSFNVRGEPIVNNAYDAYSCFMNTDIDYLIIGNRLFNKNEQPKFIDKKKVKMNLD